MSWKQPEVDGLDIRHLKYFLAVAELGSVSDAALELGLAQPSLSQQIIRLERRLEVKLFDRVPYGVELSSAGSDFFPIAKQIVTALSDYLQNRPAITRQLRVGICSGVPSSVLFNLETAVRDFAGSAQTSLAYKSVHSRAQAQLLRAGTIDIGIVRLPVDLQELLATTISSAPLGAVVSRQHRLAGRSRLVWSDLVGQELLWFHRHRAPEYSDRVLALLRSNGWVPQIQRMDASHALFEHSLTTTENIVALRPEHSITNSPLLTWIPIDDAPTEDLAIVVRIDSEFVNLLDDVADATPAR